MKLAQKLVCASLSMYFGVGLAKSGNGLKPETPPWFAIFARLVSPCTISMMSRILSLLARPASGLMPAWLMYVFSSWSWRMTVSGMDSGQAAEQHRVGLNQRLHVGDDGVDIVGYRAGVVGVDASEDAASRHR